MNSIFSKYRLSYRCLLNTPQKKERCFHFFFKQRLRVLMIIILGLNIFDTVEVKKVTYVAHHATRYIRTVDVSSRNDVIRLRRGH